MPQPAARLGDMHLCWLVRQARHPRCPINGILVCFGSALTAAEESATLAGTVCRLDIATIQEVVQVHCPVYVLIADCDQVPGFTELVERFPEQRRALPLGRRFPFVADLEPPAARELIESGTQWMAHGLFPPLVYRLLELEGNGQESTGNGALVELLSVIRDQQRRLARLLTVGFAAGDQRGPMLLGGCYLGQVGPALATHSRGEDRGQTRPAFVAGVFRRLIESQNCVAWTASALSADARYLHWIFLAYAGVGVALAALVLWLLWLS